MLSQIGYYMLCHLRGDYASPVQLAELPSVRPLLFITPWRTPPKRELKCARSEVMAANPGPATSDLGIFWCSWSMAGRDARLLWEKHRHKVGEEPWLRLLLDLWRDLEYRDLMREPFQRIPQPIDRLPYWNYSSRIRSRRRSGRLGRELWRKLWIRRPDRRWMSSELTLTTCSFPTRRRAGPGRRTTCLSSSPTCDTGGTYNGQTVCVPV
jgi:hypothetical protein